MCGRYSLAADIEALRVRFSFVEEGQALQPRFNIAPTQEVLVVTQHEGRRHGELMRWGLIPRWAKDSTAGGRMINARAESLAERPVFRAAFQRRRCLILANGFYEWQHGPKVRKATVRGTTPYRFIVRGGVLFAFAGVWEAWKDPATGLWVHSCAIITTQANALMAPVHDRMPVVLRRGEEGLWLSPETQDVADLAGLLRPYPAEEMEAYPVSSLVNSPKYDGPECIARVELGMAEEDVHQGGLL